MARKAAATPLAITYLPLDGLRPYAGNARRHSRSQIDKLKASLVRFGWTVPMAIAGGQMIAGHGRLLAAAELRDAGTPIPRNADPASGPTVDLAHLSKEDRRLYVLADNRLSDDSDWDPDQLRIELADLQSLGLDLSAAGFDLGEISIAIGGWNPDFSKLDAIKGETSGLETTFEIVCATEDAERVRAELAAAVARIKGASLVD